MWRYSLTAVFGMATIAPISENQILIEIIGRARLSATGVGISVMKKNLESLDGESTPYGNARLKKAFVNSWAF
jgi:hypothetical protein